MSNARKLEWQRQNRRAFKAEHGYSTTAHYGAGGNREAVLKRDGYACVQCGMTDQQHRERWGRPITIDHRDRNRKNSAPENLQTLCLKCHGRKDLLPSLRIRKAEAMLPDMLSMRERGSTYQQIADDLHLSVATVWKYLNRRTP